MKRMVSLAAALALSLALSAGAQAAAAARLVRAFVYQDNVYTYVEISGTDQPITKADAEIEGRTFPADSTLETVRQAGFPVTWMLLVDNSNSMPPFREDAAAFAESLAAAGGENTRFLLASFGDSFSLLAEDVSPEDLAGEMAAIPMDETVTRLHSSISQALNCFNGMPRTGNELRGLIVLSDAVQYDPGASVSYEELLERVNASDVMLHSVGFGTDTAALESLASLTEASGGTHQVVGDGLTAEEAAASLSAQTGELYVTSFSLSGFTPSDGTPQLSVTFASDGELVCRGTTAIPFPSDGETAGDPAEEEPAPLPPSSPEAELPAADSAPAGAGAPSESAGESSAHMILLPAIGVAVVLAAAAGIFLLRRKKSSPAAAPQPAPVPQPSQPEEDGIYMRLEIFQGTYQGSGLEFTLRHELIIGRDAACDIPFGDNSVSRQHARVFMTNGTVYLEDLGSQNGTCVNGSRIEMASVLRSGDQISLGDVVFALKF